MSVVCVALDAAEDVECEREVGVTVVVVVLRWGWRGGGRTRHAGAYGARGGRVNACAMFGGAAGVWAGYSEIHS